MDSSKVLGLKRLQSFLKNTSYWQRACLACLNKQSIITSESKSYFFIFDDNFIGFYFFEFNLYFFLLNLRLIPSNWSHFFKIK